MAENRKNQSLSEKLIDERVEQIRRWIRGTLTEDLAKEAVERVLASHKYKLSVAMVALALRNTTSVLRLLEEMDTVEAEVFRGAIDPDTNYDSKVKAYRALSDSVKVKLDTISKVLASENAGREKLGYEEISLQLKNPQLEDLKPSERENTRNILKDLLGEIEERVKSLPESSDTEPVEG